MTQPAKAEGFLYVEMLVGLTLLSIALMALVPMFVMAAHKNAAATDMTAAGTAAWDKAEDLRSVDWASLTAGAGQDTLIVRGRHYRRTWLVVDDAPHPDMKQITVTVEPVRKGKYRPDGTFKLSYHRGR